MKRIAAFLAVFLSFAANMRAEEWKGMFLTLEHTQSRPNTWIMWRKTADIPAVPSSVKAKIATDTKYWLYINGKMAVFEGCLKRGPEPHSTYYDEVEIAPYLKPGENIIAILTWYYGLNGFSHVSSGMAGMVFEASGDGVEILSDGSWTGGLYEAFGETGDPRPNYRISECNIRFDARKEIQGWYASDDVHFGSTVLAMDVENSSLGTLVKRPIPLWKDRGMQEYAEKVQKGDTLVCRLPYNCQCTPYVRLKADKGGKTVKIQTDVHDIGGSGTIRCELITREGEQEYENLAWFNGHEVWYIIPEGVEILDVKYHETGYGSDFTELFKCDNGFFNELWKRAQRTLYITMRDNFMDCPDRERGQWWGDAVNEIGEAFYALAPDGNKLGFKALDEIFSWQRKDGVLFAPVPAGNWNRELPSQILATAGWYGLYMQSYFADDFSIARKHYDRLHRYLHDVWQTDGNGFAVLREGDWLWGDWGTDIDQTLLQATWYYLALKGEREFARRFGFIGDVEMISGMMKKMEENYDKVFWTGTAFRSPGWKGDTDDRCNALAVVSGLASKDKYPALTKVLTTEYHASPYMEKYVLEALFCMGAASEGLDRIYKRYKTMVEYPGLTTLPENWVDETRKIAPGEPMVNAFFGTYNHGWTGGPLTILSQKVCGVEPTSPGFKTFSVTPQLGYLKEASCHVDSVNGHIAVSVERQGAKRLSVSISVPEGCEAEIIFPSGKKHRVGAGENNVTDL